MAEPNFILLYVADTGVSVDFYTRLMGKGPIEQAPTFAMFALSSGVMLGLWQRDGVLPPATAPGGGELAFAVGDVDGTHAEWAQQGITILQSPTNMDFGRTFLAADPDQHRLRVFAPPG